MGLQVGVSYHKFEEVLQERGIAVDHTTIQDGCDVMRPRSRSAFGGVICLD